ncbi:hypothetical protein [Salinispora vitiensis]|uniref:hypothetical protein n=1 Tax=Salinispora vitiensis TaxID=999544 RepID=UPI00035C3084|nr:hypothetical protein [Salinispora vitiensis]
MVRTNDRLAAIFRFRPDRASRHTPVTEEDLPQPSPQDEGTADDRELNFIAELLWQLGGQADYQTIASAVPPGLLRPDDEVEGNPTRLQWALRRGVWGGWFSVEPNGHNYWFLLTEVGCGKANLGSLEGTDLRKLLALAQQLATGVFAMASGEIDGPSRENYGGIAAKLAELVHAAGIAATRCGHTGSTKEYLGQVDVLFHDITRSNS